MPKHSIITTAFAKVYPMYVQKGGTQGSYERRDRPDHLLADGL